MSINRSSGPTPEETMNAFFDLPAPAKLNLFLHILGRRSDGYHLLQSVFVLIDWCDTLHIERTTDGRIQRKDLGWALPVDDLTVRAARVLQSATGCTLGATITVNKRIPAQAGMGGGSSDAATCLLALNRLWDLNLSLKQLIALGLPLGADIPFFLRGTNAWVEGVGEKIQPIHVPRQRFVVVKPTQGIPTKDVFLHPELKRDTGHAIIEDFAVDPFGFGCNDLQPIAERLCPSVREVTLWLRKYGLNGRMTGSGSAVFAPVALAGCVGDPPQGWSMRVCSSLDSHPLTGWASSDD